MDTTLANARLVNICEEASEDLKGDWEYRFDFNSGDIFLRRPTGPRKYEETFLGSLVTGHSIVQMPNSAVAGQQPLIYQLDQSNIDIAEEE